MQTSSTRLYASFSCPLLRQFWGSILWPPFCWGSGCDLCRNSKSSVFAWWCPASALRHWKLISRKFGSGHLWQGQICSSKVKLSLSRWESTYLQHGLISKFSRQLRRTASSKRCPTASPHFYSESKVGHYRMPPRNFHADSDKSRNAKYSNFQGK